MISVSHAIGHLRLGAGRYVVDLAMQQARNLNCSVSVLVSKDADGNWRTDPALVSELKLSGIPTVVVGDFFHRELAALRDAAAKISRQRPSGHPWLIHAHTAMAAVAGHWAGADAVVATCHGWDPNRPSAFNLQDALAYRLCAAITSPSAFWAGKVAQELGVPMPSVIPVGLDLARYPARKDSIRLGQPIKIVTVCELTPRKGVNVLIRAMPDVWERYESIELHILGDGDAAADLRSLAAQVDVSGKRIRFHGYHKNPYDALVHYDIFVLASRSDNLPVALIEALFARMPLVTTQVGGIPEIVDDGRFAMLVSPDSPAAITTGLLQILSKPDLALDLACKGEQFARTHFSVYATATALDGLYRRTLSPIITASPVPDAAKPPVGAAAGGSLQDSDAIQVLI
jgi:glycosyltransferase involved in cell wall biosynthesis